MYIDVVVCAEGHRVHTTHSIQLHVISEVLVDGIPPDIPAFDYVRIVSQSMVCKGTIFTIVIVLGQQFEICFERIKWEA